MKRYKGYYGTVEYSSSGSRYCGKLAYIDDLVTFESDNKVDLEKEFQVSVDDYLDLCKKVGKQPQKPTSLSRFMTSAQRPGFSDFSMK